MCGLGKTGAILPRTPRPEPAHSV